MADYISREAAIERFCNVYCGCSPEECGFKIPQDGAEECAAVRALKEVPAADVVEVVRCKDCRFYYEDSDGYEMCDASEGYDHISADGFCAWAKRRADDDPNSSDPSQVP